MGKLRRRGKLISTVCGSRGSCDIGSKQCFPAAAKHNSRDIKIQKLILFTENYPSFISRLSCFAFFVFLSLCSRKTRQPRYKITLKLIFGFLYRGFRVSRLPRRKMKCRQIPAIIRSPFCDPPPLSVTHLSHGWAAGNAGPSLLSSLCVQLIRLTLLTYIPSTCL